MDVKFEEQKDLSIFLEKGLKELYSHDVKSAAIIACIEGKQIFIGYFKADVADKLLYAGYIQQDAMIATLQNNGQIVKDIVDSDNYSDPDYLENMLDSELEEESDSDYFELETDDNNE